MKNLPATLLEKVFLVVSLSIVSASALAHPGHDHGSVSATLMHVLFYGASLLAIAFAGFVLYQHVKKKSDNR